jgi:uncharacterized surface protein with fasciclin (FAS1) repeats
MMKSHLCPCLVFLIAALFLAACAKQDTPEAPPADQAATAAAPASGQSAVVDSESDANALQVAQSLDDFTTLVAAIEAAGVQDALVNVGPLTVFAPVNAAFDKLPEGTVESLVQPENKAKLTFILINHVAPSNYPIATLEKNAQKGRKLYMASGKYLEVETKDDGIYVGGTKILQSVNVSNGWIHVIDTVLVPEE